MITCTKIYEDLPFAHRQHKHDGHCALIHGHNWAFEFEFAADSLDSCGFVVDFGKLKWLKQWLADRFDHTLVLNEDDPQLPHLRRALEEYEEPEGIVPAMSKITVVPDCSCEGLAQFLLCEVNFQMRAGWGEGDLISRNVRVIRVRVIEDSKNSAQAVAVSGDE